ncbi:MarR family transcriptional regulator [Rhizobiaceae bacterium]|nr:MarR family transcriptional regulator [Rhizobiaceae bacterium]
MKITCAAQTVRLAARRLTRRYEEALRPLNLTASQYTILTALVSSGGLRQGMLGDLLGFEQTTTTRLLATMAKRGLVIFEPDPNDARSKIVRASANGHAAYAEGHALWEAAQKETLNAVTPEEWAETKRVLSRLTS